MSSMQRLTDVEGAAQLIRSGAAVLVAGDEALLASLPQGNWIGGTIPYFITEQGGLFSKDQLFVSVLPAVQALGTRCYAPEALGQVFVEAAAASLSFVLIPGMSDAHLRFALEAPSYPRFGQTPLAGWIAGVDLADLGRRKPKVFDGRSGRAYDDLAVVLDLALPEGTVANVEIVNIFECGDGDAIQFPQTGFSVEQAIVNGELVRFADYVEQHALDTRLPLVSNWGGARVNTSFQRVAVAEGRVDFYAPVFANLVYKLARPLPDYAARFAQAAHPPAGEVAFSCNCILNYLHGALEGKRTGSFVGPVTFGEIAYQLVNQTLVYVELENL